MVTAKIIILVYSNVLDDSVLCLFFILFKSYKTELNSHPALSRSCNDVGNTVPELEGAVGEGIGEVVSEGTGPTLRPLDFNRCYRYVESVKPMFDPRRVLIRRTFFINEDCSKYLSVGYYPVRDYQPLMEVGASTKMPVRLTEEHVRTFVQHLPRIVRPCVATNNIPVWMAS